jgi:delta 1-pyrroline-5-carboxylate dehydrogenase
MLMSLPAAAACPPENDPNLSMRRYARARRAQGPLKQMAAETVDIPIIIGGKECRTAHTEKVVMPHKHGHVLGNFHKATPEHIHQAAEAAVKARKEWSSWSFDDRAAVFLRAAELLTTTWRSTVVAATMLGQSKTAFQAEIDAASELVDFWRFKRRVRTGAPVRATRQLSLRLEPDGVPARSKDLSTRSRRSTSPRSVATSPARPR